MVSAVKPFSELKVVELAGSIAGAYCAKLFADNGAQVVTLGESQLKQSQSLYLDRGKLTGVAEETDRIRNADVVIRSAPYSSLQQPFFLPGPETILVEISPYGSSGPYSDWLGTSATVYAHSGHTYLTGDPEREPLMGPPTHPPYAAGLFAFIGAMGALFDRERNGQIHSVEVTHLEVLVALHQMSFVRYQLGNDVLCRMGNRWTGQGQPNGMYRCADGWLALSAPTDVQLETLLSITGLTDLLDDPRIQSPMDFQEHPQLLDEHLVPWLLERESRDVVELFQAAQIPSAPANTIFGLLEDDHLEDRNFWRQAGSWLIPGPPFQTSFASGTPTELPASEGGEGPLSGIRVLDLAKVWAGPLAARILAELGAQVIQVEAPWGRGPRELPESLVVAQRFHPDNIQGPDQWNRNGHLIKYGLNKESVVLDLSREEGLATFERLVPNVDVLIENFSPRVMPQLGLDEHHLHHLNEDLIYMTMPGYGRSGPAENWVAYGTTVDSHAGLSQLVGYKDEHPWKCGVAWPDPIAGLHAAAAVLTALWDRSTKGGVTIEAAQFEATISVIGDVILEAQMNDHEPLLMGNRDHDYVPQGVYPCKGSDQWASISITDQGAWETLCQVAQLPEEWAQLGKSERQILHDSIDAALGSWTSNFDQIDLAESLQDQGIAAAPVLNVPGVLADKHLEARSVFGMVEQPRVGAILFPCLPIHFSAATERPPTRPAPVLGENNRAVLRNIGGLSATELEDLESLGVVATEPPV
ncbi:MAG: CoA transferase [Acidimicrobiales bacterium]|jgi:crotonobetainyl-CoA:carnitine CoA-transferase CaiB-like acyl-CoA transferase|nr:CoA transferase [Acidimicrobiales bacterium]HJL99402.1 CoA transferase [Acidimicrobiales bacterium]